MSPRSVRFRITAVAAAVVVVVLVSAALAIVVVVQRELETNLDRSLAQRADQVESASLVDPVAAVANTNQEDRFVQVLGPSGTVLASSDNLAGLPAVVEPPDGDQAASTHTDIPIEDDGYRVLIRRFDVGGTDRYVIVGENVDDVSDAVRLLEGALVATIAIAIVLLTATVWWLVGRTLRPVELIRRRVSAIGLDDLDQRVPTHGSGDEIDRLAGTMNDMLARLQASAAAQRRFIADASHELRTPLTRLRTALEVDLSQPDSDFETTSRRALGDAIDMQTLVDDLLFLARRASNAPDERRERLDVDIVIEAEVAASRSVTDVEIDTTAVDAAQVAGEPHQIARMVRNLLGNAIRHATTRVVIALVADGPHVVLSIDDDGDGVPDRDRLRVFERFVRLDAARTDRDGGIGLGLAIVRDIVTDHGGTVRVTDAPIGGARFTVRLPNPAATDHA